jgi:hypothetical protein
MGVQCRYYLSFIKTSSILADEMLGYVVNVVAE